MNGIECAQCGSPATIATASGVRVYACPTCSRQWSNVRCASRGCGRYGLAACKKCQDAFCSNHVSRERVCGRCRAVKRAG